MAPDATRAFSWFRGWTDDTRKVLLRLVQLWETHHGSADVAADPDHAAPTKRLSFWERVHGPEDNDDDEKEAPDAPRPWAHDEERDEFEGSEEEEEERLELMRHVYAVCRAVDLQPKCVMWKVACPLYRVGRLGSNCIHFPLIASVHHHVMRVVRMGVQGRLEHSSWLRRLRIYQWWARQAVTQSLTRWTARVPKEVKDLASDLNKGAKVLQAHALWIHARTFLDDQPACKRVTDVLEAPATRDQRIFRLHAAIQELWLANRILEDHVKLDWVLPLPLGHPAAEESKKPSTGVFRFGSPDAAEVPTVRLIKTGTQKIEAARSHADRVRLRKERERYNGKEATHRTALDAGVYAWTASPPNESWSQRVPVDMLYWMGLLAHQCGASALRVAALSLCGQLGGACDDMAEHADQMRVDTSAMPVTADALWKSLRTHPTVLKAVRAVVGNGDTHRTLGELEDPKQKDMPQLVLYGITKSRLDH